MTFKYKKIGEREIEITKYKGLCREVDIPSEIDGLRVTSIGAKAFFLRNIKSVTIPDGVISIGEKAFSNCYFLKHIELPDSMIIIGKNAFAYCESLRNIKIPISVTCIGRNAFKRLFF